MAILLYFRFKGKRHSLHSCPVEILATCSEFLFAIFCSILCLSYALRHEDDASNSPHYGLQLPPLKQGYFTFILDPPPVLMLAACLGLGCAVSSFAYRRQRHDRFQAFIFVTALTLATVLGYSLKINANVIMLGLVPWALCISMILSITMHWIARRLTRRTYVELHCCELGISEKEVTPKA